MAVIEEFARPKVNLTLHVLGRRPDGYHEIESLVAFAHSPVDVLRFDTAAPHGVTVDGAFGSKIAAENLILQTLRLAAQTHPDLKLGAATLEKRLPVTAGIGGGSADAAAMLRALRRANPDIAGSIDWRALARRLGADVSVCLENRAAWMRGIGEIVEPLPGPLQLQAVLVNRLEPVPDNKTAEVFRRLAASPLDTDDPKGAGQPAAALENLEQAPLLDTLSAAANDLEAPAIELMTGVADTLAVVAATDGCRLARMSGAGPTVFGLYETEASARNAAHVLQQRHPGWWIVATALS